MKKGFTLIELLLVISILAVAATSCVISFNKSDEASNEEELKTRYKDIQRGAILFVDLNDINLANFTNSKVVTVTFSDIKKYLSRGNSRAFINPVTGENMPLNYLVEITMSDSTTVKENCICPEGEADCETWTKKCYRSFKEEKCICPEGEADCETWAKACHEEIEKEYCLCPEDEDDCEKWKKECYEKFEYVKSCIMTAKVKTYVSGETTETLKELTCIANQDGDACECCNFEAVDKNDPNKEELLDANGKPTGYYKIQMDGETVSIKNDVCK